jgi:hypothetical protein
MRNKLKIRKNLLKRIVKRVVIESSAYTDRPHRTMSGEDVPFGCDSCIEDLDNRIEDAAYHRDHCLNRTDARGHYNGLLNVLRRDRRAARKENELNFVAHEDVNL